MTRVAVVVAVAVVFAVVVDARHRVVPKSAHRMMLARSGIAAGLQLCVAIQALAVIRR